MDILTDTLGRVYVSADGKALVGQSAWTAEVTFASRLRNGIVMQLPDVVLRHKDNPDFTMMYVCKNNTLVNYRSYMGVVSNRKWQAGNYHGAYLYNNILGNIYYPPNSSDGEFSVDGVFKIKYYISDGKLYIAEDIGCGFDAGTYRFTFSW